MSTESRLARLGLSHLANDPEALDRALAEGIAADEARGASWQRRQDAAEALTESICAEWRPKARTISLLAVTVREAPEISIELYLGEFKDAWSTPLTVGSASDNRVVIELPGVAARACTLRALSNHVMLTLGSAAEMRIDRAPFDVGPLRLQVVERGHDGRALVTPPGPIRIQPAPIAPAPAEPAVSPQLREAVRNLVWLADVTWLKPSAELATGMRSAREELRGRLCAHHAALERPRPQASDVVYVGTRNELRLMWLQAWGPIDVYRDRESVAYVNSLGASGRDKHDLYRVVERMLAASEPTAAMIGRKIGTTPWAHLACMLACRIAAGENTETLRPLLEVYKLGVWPAALPGDRWVVWVPRWRDDAIVPEEPALMPILRSDVSSVARHYHDIASVVFP